MDDWLTIKEAAPALRMSTQALYAAIREQQLPADAVLRIGRRIRIDPLALRNSRTHRASETAAPQAAGENGGGLSEGEARDVTMKKTPTLGTSALSNPTIMLRQ